MDDLDRLHARATFLFAKLKETMAAIEAVGGRPVVITYSNGTLDSFGVYPPHPTTPQVEEIRMKKLHSD